MAMKGFILFRKGQEPSAPTADNESSAAEANYDVGYTSSDAHGSQVNEGESNIETPQTSHATKSEKKNKLRLEHLVFVMFMPRKTRHEEILALFEKYGTIVSVLQKDGRIPDNGIYKEMAYIQFSNESEAIESLAASGEEMGKRKIKVIRAEKLPTAAKISTGSVAYFIGNLPYRATRKGIAKLFKDSGTVLSVRLSPAIKTNDGDDEADSNAGNNQDSNKMTDEDYASVSEEHVQLVPYDRKGFIPGTDGNHGGYGWVIFQEGKFDPAKVRRVNGATFGGRRVKVQKAAIGDKTSKTVMVKKAKAQKRKLAAMLEAEARAEEQRLWEEANPSADTADEYTSDEVRNTTSKPVIGLKNSTQEVTSAPVEERVYTQEKPERTEGRKKKKKKAPVYYKPKCLMFTNTGKCDRGDDCMFTHDAN